MGTEMLNTAIEIAAHSGPWGGGPGWLFVLVPLLWIALIVLLVAIVGRRWRHRAMAGGYGPWSHGPWSHGARGAEGTLSERFAQGEIDEAEYTSRLGVLRANSRNEKHTSA